MNEQELTPIMLEIAAEQLRQERETFEQQRRHEERWFSLRLVMGYSAVILLAVVMVLSSYILVRNYQFPSSAVRAAGAALFIDVLVLLIGVRTIALSPNFLAKLEPVTTTAVLNPPSNPATRSHNHAQNNKRASLVAEVPGAEAQFSSRESTSRLEKALDARNQYSKLGLSDTRING